MTRSRLKKVIDKRTAVDKELNKKGIKLKDGGGILKRSEQNVIPSKDVNEYEMMQLQKKKLKEEILRKILEDEEERKLLEEEIARVKREEIKIVNTINGNDVNERAMIYSLNRSNFDLGGHFYNK
jgi:hypothetical protein